MARPLLAPLLASLLLTAQASATNFADDFENGSLSQWTCNPCEDWSVTCASSEGTALVIQPFAPALLSTLCINGLEWADFELDVDLQGLIPTDKMVRFRYSEQTGEYYYVNLRSHPANDLWLSRFVPANGQSTTLATVPLAHQVGQWNHVAIKAEGSRIRVWVDDQLRIDATDSSPLVTGTICLGGWTGGISQCGIRWDNVQVTDLVVSANSATWGQIKGTYGK